jgi:predicted transcriptional regulator
MVKQSLKMFLSTLGISSNVAKMLYDAGFDDIEKLRRVSVEEIVRVCQIAPHIAVRIKNALPEKRSSKAKKRPLKDSEFTHDLDEIDKYLNIIEDTIKEKDEAISRSARKVQDELDVFISELEGEDLSESILALLESEPLFHCPEYITSI